MGGWRVRQPPFPLWGRKMSDLSDTHHIPKRGQILFAVFFLIVSVLLASLLWDQTVWKKGKDLFSQARFWPAVGVFGMLGFTALHLWHLPRRRFDRVDWQEGRIWLTVLEWVLWFLAYVWLVPLIGYMPVTLVFAPLLTLRLGYRSRKMIWLSVVIGAAIVLFFKAFLQVKIPGAALYEYLPGGIRTFFILYL